jgi:condensin complex subunit 1
MGDGADDVDGLIAEEFKVPSDITDLEVASGDRYSVREAPVDLRDEGAAKLHELLEGAISAMEAVGAEGLAQSAAFDPLYALVRDFKYIPSEVKGRVLVVLTDALGKLVPLLGGQGQVRGRAGQGQGQGQASLALRNAFKMCVYLLFSASWAAEGVYSSAKQNEMLNPGAKGKGKASKKTGKDDADDGKFSWESSRLNVLHSMTLALSVDMQRIWNLGVPDEEFISLFTRLAYKMLELPATIRSKPVKAEVFQLIAVPYCSVASMQATVSAAILQLITNYEHLPAAMAELCLTIFEQKEDTRLGVDLLREIGRSDMADATRNAAGIRNTSSFLVELGNCLPHVIFSNISILLPLFDCEPYALRSALCNSISSVLVAAHREKMTDMDNNRMRMEGKTRDALLDMLVERAHDISSYTRAAVLRSWATLVEARALPLDRVITVAKLGTDRLSDKSSIARKAALQLLETLLEHNPYMGSLHPEPYRVEAERVEHLLQSMPAPQPSLTRAELEALEELEDEDEDEDENTDVEHEKPQPRQDEELLPKKKQKKRIIDDGSDQDEDDAAADDEDDDDDDDDNDADGDQGGEGSLAPPEGAATAEAEEGDLTPEEKERSDLLRQLVFFRSALAFISVYEDAATQMQGMLASKTTSDVTEALGFFVTARRFDLPCASSSIRKSLTLIWHSETAVQDAVMQCFVGIIVKAPSSSHNLPPRQIADNLIELVAQSSVAELASLEEVVGRLTLDQSLPPSVFDQLWLSVAAKRSDGEDAAIRANSLTTLSMATKVKQSVADSLPRLEAIASYALGKQTQEARDWKAVRAACLVLQQCSPPSGAGDKTSAIVETCISRLCQFLQGQWCVSEQGLDLEQQAEAEADMLEWFAAAEQAIAVIFALSPRPELQCAACIKKVAFSTVVLPSDKATEVSSLSLARLCFLLGHIALKLLVYTEDIAARLKRMRAAKEKVGSQKKAADGPAPDSMEAELGMTAEDEAEEEKSFAELIEVEIVGRNLLGAFGPLLARIVANEGGTFDHPFLRDSAVLALCKYMCISSEVCERYLDLLFTTLEKAKERSLRSNVVIALGDLAFRFPNSVEPWNHLIYARLRDEDSFVRSNVLMVLTHLILNDMVKVKGLVSDIATCILDPVTRIGDMARLFFNELSNRSNNPIYNLLPDIVSRLGNDDSLSPPQFREIMSFLLSFIKKDKQTEGLVDKLMARINAAEDVQQRRDMSYCLAQLQITEKSVKRLTESIATYKDALSDPEVYDNFLVLVKNARKFAKPEMKDAVEEWNQQLLALHEGGADEVGAAVRASKASKRAGRRKGGAATTDSASRDNDGDAPPAAASPKRRAPARTRAKRTVKVAESDSEDEGVSAALSEDSGDDDPIFAKKGAAAVAPKSRSRRNK